MDDKKVRALVDAVNELTKNDIRSAEEIIKDNYPFIPVKKEGRNYTPQQMMEQFFSDGFVDRYSGKKLVNPGILRVMSEYMPNTFPFQTHWKTDECHIAYWDFQPTVDHIYPISLGGKDEPENWASTSMMNNAAKGNFTLEQLGWTLKEKGNIEDWDGLSNAFIKMVENNTDLLNINKIKSWYKATKTVMVYLGYDEC